jgi:curved DNA-binding protein CbpA
MPRQPTPTQPGASLYDVLGLQPSASQEEVQRAYRRLALRYHPDKATGDPAEAADAFRRVAAAYQVLSDRERRDVYDRYGEEGLQLLEQARGFMKSDQGTALTAALSLACATLVCVLPLLLALLAVAAARLDGTCARGAPGETRPAQAGCACVRAGGAHGAVDMRDEAADAR